MGSGASNVPEGTSATITKALLDEFDKLKLTDMSDEEINKALVVSYRKLIDEHHGDKAQGWEASSSPHDLGMILRSPSKLNRKQEEEMIIRLQTRSLNQGGRMAVSSSLPKLQPLQSPPGANAAISPPPKRAAARRKSFSQVRLPSIVEVKAPSDSEPDVPHGVDSWDSVTQQPFCNVCMMAFKTMSALDRHEQFSELHVRVLKKKMDEYENGLKGDEPLQVQQIEGVHFKLLYTGRKLYWRTQESVDFSFYYHFGSDVVEVIAFDSSEESTAEINRLYLDSSKLKQIVSELFARKEFDDKEMDMIAAQTPEEKEETLRLSLTTYLLSRLGTEDDTKPIYAGGNAVAFKLGPSDPVDLLPLLKDMPKQLTPVKIQSRRRSSTQEIDSAIAELSKATGEVAKHTSTADNYSQITSSVLDAAERITTIVSEAADILATNVHYRSSLHPRQKWVWAIGRVQHAIKTAKAKKTLGSATAH